ncbi:MAG: hypothetical protein VX768_04810 [Planctomycetota bacterium]|nr:hypothetical protein [Planctomycetota bacterium]
MKLHQILFSALASSLLSPSLSMAQLSLAEAEKISAETGRTMFVVAGKKT